MTSSRASARIPPKAIDSCLVLAYVSIPDDVPYANTGHIYADGRWLGRVPRLAICEWNFRPELMLFHCDKRWRSLGCEGPAGSTTVADLVNRAERQYPGLRSHWTYLPLAANGRYTPLQPNAGGWKTCASGHKYRNLNPCPICWPELARARIKYRRVWTPPID